MCWVTICVYHACSLTTMAGTAHFATKTLCGALHSGQSKARTGRGIRQNWFAGLLLVHRWVAVIFVMLSFVGQDWPPAVEGMLWSWELRPRVRSYAGHTLSRKGPTTTRKWRYGLWPHPTLPFPSQTMVRIIIRQGLGYFVLAIFLRIFFSSFLRLGWLFIPNKMCDFFMTLLCQPLKDF